MDNNCTYILPVKKLPHGSHTFNYVLGHDFFADLDQNEILNGSVNVVVTVKKSQQTIGLTIEGEGNVVVTCDRCLDEMTLPVVAEDDFTVIFGDEYAEDGDNVVVVPEQEGEFDVSWLIYETILLALPFNHTHAEGECNPEMEDVIERYTPGAETQEEETISDPRWDALKQMK